MLQACLNMEKFFSNFFKQRYFHLFRWIRRIRQNQRGMKQIPFKALNKRWLCGIMVTAVGKWSWYSWFKTPFCQSSFSLVHLIRPIIWEKKLDCLFDNIPTADFSASELYLVCRWITTGTPREAMPQWASWGSKVMEIYGSLDLIQQSHSSLLNLYQI